MSDFKSKLPNFEEITSMTSKLFKGIKKSVDEIIHDYKEKRAADEKKETAAEKKESTAEKKPAKESTEEKSETTVKAAKSEEKKDAK